MTFDPETRSRLVGVFVDEAQETLAALELSADRLRDATPPEALTEFGRCAHGLKGAAASLGYEELARLLHALEELSLGLDEDAPGRRLERYVRLRDALSLLANGIAEMAASAHDGFPPAVGAALGDLLGVAAQPALPPAAPGGTADAMIERLSVPAADVDEALRIAASLARGAAVLEERLAGGADAPAAHALAAAAQHLEASIAALRMVPAGSALAGLATEVEHLAARLGKRVRLEIVGRDVRADRRTLQTARGLLRHLIRNAIDHGIEAPEHRSRFGKPSEGRLALSVETAESALRVALSDDGAGFDLAAIRRELAHRTEDAERVAALSDADVLHQFAAEGGSTREEVSEVSGRGLGLSAVAAATRAAGGSFDVTTTRGSGSTITFALPLDVYAIEVLDVTAGRRFGIPLSAVERSVCIAAAPEAVQAGPAGRMLAAGEAIVPFVNLAAALGDPPGPERFAIVVRTPAGALGLGVDELADVTSVVPKTAGAMARSDALVSGVARLGDGSALQIVNPRLLAAAARAAGAHGVPSGGGPDEAARTPRPPSPGRALDVVLAEDSLATREVLRVLLEQQGFTVRLAADGDEALARIRERLPDVLVTDINMPRRDGLALTRELRATDRTARLPVILLTSQDDHGTRAAGAAAGADAYLLKSRFDAAILDETLSRLGVRKSR